MVKYRIDLLWVAAKQRKWVTFWEWIYMHYTRAYVKLQLLMLPSTYAHACIHPMQPNNWCVYQPTFLGFENFCNVITWNKNSCPCIHAVPTATEGSAQQPKLQRRPYWRGPSSPNIGAAQKRAKQKCHLWF